MKTFRGEEAQKEAKWFEQARKQACLSTCLRAQCGSVIVKDKRIIGAGFNSPPANSESQRRCQNRQLAPGFKSDRTCCIHAEQRAIMAALREFPYLIEGSSLYFIRLDQSGQIELAGQPYCTICSKMALDSGIRYFYLWHNSGIIQYETEEYNLLSFAYKGE